MRLFSLLYSWHSVAPFASASFTRPSMKSALLLLTTGTIAASSSGMPTVSFAIPAFTCSATHIVSMNHAVFKPMPCLASFGSGDKALLSTVQGAAAMSNIHNARVTWWQHASVQFMLCCCDPRPKGAASKSINSSLEPRQEGIDAETTFSVLSRQPKCGRSSR